MINIAQEVCLYLLAELSVPLAEWGRIKFTITRQAISKAMPNVILQSISGDEVLKYRVYLRKLT